MSNEISSKVSVPGSLIRGSSVWWMNPYAALWESSVMESRVAEALSDSGCTVTRIQCTGLMSTGCAAMSAEGITSNSPQWKKKNVCVDCRANARRINESNFVSRFWSIDTSVTQNQLHEIHSIVESVNEENYMNLKVFDIPVGKYSVYLSLLHNKTKSVVETEGSWAEYLNDLRNSLITLNAVRNLSETEIPDYLMVYNPLYPSNRVVVEFLTGLGTKLISVSAGGLLPNRFETMNIFPDISSSQTVALSESIAAGQHIAPTPFEEHKVADHLFQLTQGKDPWVYSVRNEGRDPANVRAKLGLSESNPVVTVLLSSPDESRASIAVDAEYLETQNVELSTTEEFLNAVLVCAQELSAFDFVIRLHPRMLPNKRENVVSADVGILLSRLDNRTSNVFVNSPGQSLSIYEVMDLTDVAINHTSSSGLEFLGRGIPVVHYDPPRLGIYPYRFGFNVNRGSRLSEAVRQAFETGKQESNSRNAHAWWTTVLLRAPVYFGEQTVQSEALEDAHPSDVSTRRSLLSIFKSFVPARIAVRLSRSSQRRKRLSQQFPPVTSTDQQSEIIDRIEHLQYGPIWEPQIRVRDF